MGELGARTILAPILWRQGKQVRRTTPRLPEAAAPAREAPVAVRPCDCSFLDLAKRADSCAAQTLPAELTSFGFHGWFRFKATLASSRWHHARGHRMVTSELRREGEHDVVVEQGYERGRPSLITLSLTVRNRQLAGVAIGGDAVAVNEGTIQA